MFKTNCLPFLFLLLCIPCIGLASTGPNTEDYSSGKISRATYQSRLNQSRKDLVANNAQQSHQQKRLAKMEARLEKMLQRHQSKRGIDNLRDTTDRWFWIGTGSLTIGILITIISGGTIGAVGLGIFWLLSFAFGAFSLVLWLKKRYGE